MIFACNLIARSSPSPSSMTKPVSTISEPQPPTNHTSTDIKNLQSHHLMQKSEKPQPLKHTYSFHSKCIIRIIQSQCITRFFFFFLSFHSHTITCIDSDTHGHHITWTGNAKTHTSQETLILKKSIMAKANPKPYHRQHM